MKQLHIKQSFYFRLLIFLMACLFVGCKEEGLRPNNVITNPNGGSDSTAKIDTLPSFYSPSGVAVDAAGNIYVADFGNNLIRKITPDGAVSTVAGSDSTGSANGAGVNSSFFDPVAVAVDASNNLYVADAGNNMVRLISSAGNVTTLASDSTSSGIVFSNPTGVATDAGGNVFVANYLNNNILLINPARTVSVFAGTGVPGASNGSAGAATFYFPNSVAVDAADNVYVSDGVNNLIRKITPGGTVSTLAGSGAAGAIDSTGTAASFNGPAGLVVDAAGNVYVADSNNNLIRKITPAGVVTTIAGNGEPGAKNGVAIAYRNKRRIKNISISRLNIFYKKPSNR